MVFLLDQDEKRSFSILPNFFNNSWIVILEDVK